MEPSIDWLAHGTSYLLLIGLFFGSKYHLRVVKESNDERLKCEAAKAKLEVDFRETIEKLKDEHADSLEKFYQKNEALVERVIVAVDVLRNPGKGR